MSGAPCHVCGGSRRITVLTTEGLGGWSKRAVMHCRQAPEHDTGQPDLDRIFYKRATMSDVRWAEDDPNPSKEEAI